MSSCSLAPGARWPTNFRRSWARFRGSQAIGRRTPSSSCPMSVGTLRLKRRDVGRSCAGKARSTSPRWRCQRRYACSMCWSQMDAMCERYRLGERKGRLREIFHDTPGIQVVSALEAHGEALFAKAVELDIEGIVAKRVDATYSAGRQITWLKIKNRNYSRQEALGFRQ